jgi:choline kinase
VKVAGRSILSHQVAAFQAAGISRIVVVAGYRAAQVRAAAPSGCIVVENSEYLATNNMYSLALAETHISDELILLNGDVVFAPEILSTVLASRFSDCIATDVGRYMEESMKVAVREDGSIFQIAKTVSREDAFGTSIDLYRFSGKAVAMLFRHVAAYLQKGDRKQWTEVAINDLVKETAVYPVDIAGRDWVEIDNAIDLREAETKWSQTAI